MIEGTPRFLGRKFSSLSARVLMISVPLSMYYFPCLFREHIYTSFASEIHRCRSTPRVSRAPWGICGETNIASSRLVCRPGRDLSRSTDLVGSPLAEVGLSLKDWTARGHSIGLRLNRTLPRVRPPSRVVGSDGRVLSTYEDFSHRRVPSSHRRSCSPQGPSPKIGAISSSSLRHHPSPGISCHPSAYHFIPAEVR